MNATKALHNLGQSLWLDNITRDILDNGTLQRYINELSVTGLTSNPTIFDHAIKNSTHYDSAIREKLVQGKSGEALFFELALEDLRRAADLFRPIHEKTKGVDGWVSLEVSPLLAYDASTTIAAAKDMSEGDRGAMVRGMVERLANRLKQNGDDVDGWLRLVRAYLVMGERDKAIGALGEARGAVANDTERLRQLNEGLKNLGLDG